jgi:ribosomal protein L11 methyltransferase
VIRLAVRVRREQAELVLGELLELAPAGVEEVDGGGDAVEYAVYGSPGELPQLPDLRAAAGEALVEITTSELPDDWSERWKRFHRPVLIETGMRAEGACLPASVETGMRAEGACLPASVETGTDSGDTRFARIPESASAEGAPRRMPGLYVRPPWERASGREGVEEIVIDPGQAFGTGAHATTRLCLELLLERTARAPALGPLLDVGTGSGVLAIAAARLGYSPVLALDNDPLSVAAAAANAAANGVSIEVARWDLRREPMPVLDNAHAPVMLANLLLPLLLDLARTIERPPADLIAGGLLVEQVDEVVGVYGERLSVHERQRRTEGEWAALWLTPGPAAR